ncbi:hypothetical protein KIN20_007436 [Parelaphostrongylus tenuis]|uniref:Uncharacterized protein n=1 Tax=Parelaphostrongylus tenuis TaxID=148309 RepID=A0AAD5MP54_PARTN|nr:hypothetical protein KIN20_007436 [Parelaphostrongylus tenuis]
MDGLCDSKKAVLMSKYGSFWDGCMFWMKVTQTALDVGPLSSTRDLFSVLQRTLSTS